MWSNTDLAYLAGIIDGEGTIFIQRRMDNGTWTYWSRMQVVNTYKPLIEWIYSTFGGLMYTVNRSKPNRIRKTQYQWYTRISLVDVLIPKVYPYLINKKQHAEIFMEFRKTFTHGSKKRLTNEVQLFREECMHKLKHLNL